MEDALAVGGREALAELPPDVEHALDRQGARLRRTWARLTPGDELGRHPGLALVLPDSQHRRDVRVAEGAGGLGVPPEARDGGGRALRGGSEELHCGGPVVLGLPGDVDDAAGAPAQLAAHLERPERRRLLHPRSPEADSMPPRKRRSTRSACSRGRPRVRVIGIGLDLVEMARVASALERFGERFVRKLVDRGGPPRCPGRAPSPRAAVALAVAGKEAASKALGTGWSQGVRWRDVVVSIGPEAAVRSRAARPRWRGSSGRAAGAACGSRSGGALAIGERWLLS